MNDLEWEQISVELPYKLNILYGYVFFETNKEVEINNVSETIIRCISLESSIMFGRHILQFFGITHEADYNNFKKFEKKKRYDDLLINDVISGVNLIALNDDDLVDNKCDILYLLKISNKRVAHITEYSSTHGITDKTKILNALISIHNLVEKYVKIPQIFLLKYNPTLIITT